MRSRSSIGSLRPRPAAPEASSIRPSARPIPSDLVIQGNVVNHSKQTQTLPMLRAILANDNGKPLLHPDDPAIVAVASDEPLPAARVGHFTDDIAVDAPSFFFLDIQTGQRDAFKALLAAAGYATAFTKALTTNVLATQTLLSRFHPLLRKSANARVIGMSSNVATAPRAFWGAYAASKAAFEVLLDCYAQEVRNLGKIRVAIVNPGATRTKMRAKAYPGEDPASLKPPQVVAAQVVTLLGEQFASPHRMQVNPER